MRRASVALSWFVLVGGAIALCLHTATAATTSSSYTAGIVAGSLFLVALGAVIHRPPFFIFSTAASALVVFVAAFNRTDRQRPEIIEAYFLVGLVVIIAGLTRYMFTVPAVRRQAAWSDGMVVAIGTWIPVWILLIEPSLRTDDAGTTTLLRAVVLGASIVVMFLMAVLAFSNSVRSFSLSTMALAIASALTGVILRGISFGDVVGISQFTYAIPFLFSGICAAAAMVNPSVRSIAASPEFSRTTPLMSRMVTITATLIAPIMLLALTDATDATDRTVRSISAALLTTVIVARVVQSVRENTRSQDRMLRHALTDSLTGLPNRVLMLEHISAALQQNWLTNRQPTVLFIDIDRLKSINDSLGHSTGDSVLTHVASRILLAVPEEASVARISGDEFLVLDPTTQSPTQSVLLAERVLDSLRTPLNAPSGDMFVTASIGVAYAPRNVELTADLLVRHADTAMYRAKSAGRNCIALFDDTMLEVVTKRLTMETSLYRALERRELSLVFQPIVDTDINVVNGFEALMRWNRDGETIPPDEFIPVAEETGLIVPFGIWALRDALGHLRLWIDAGTVPAHATMSVNISARQLLDPELLTQVQDALSETSIAPHQLVLEVTESIMIQETSQALSAMRKVAALGVRIAVDDFGTGYSSLSVLQHFPLHIVKIDRSFIDNVATSQDAGTLVRTIVAMAEALGAEVVAEGVETEGQMRTLQALRCSRAQGYLFHRPVEAALVDQCVKAIESRDAWLDS